MVSPFVALFNFLNKFEMILSERLNNMAKLFASDSRWIVFISSILTMNFSERLSLHAGFVPKKWNLN